MNLIEQILLGHGSKAVSSIKTILENKVLLAIKDTKGQVMSEVYGGEVINEVVTDLPFDKNRVQGFAYKHDTEHANHPFHSTLEKHGFKYDHSGSQGEHHYSHPHAHAIVSKNPYQNNKPMYSVTAHKGKGKIVGQIHRGGFGATKTGDTPEKLEAHIGKMKLKEEVFGSVNEYLSNDDYLKAQKAHEIAVAQSGKKDHPSFKAGMNSYNNTFRKAAKTLPQQERKNNETFAKVKDHHVSKFGTLPERL